METEIPVYRVTPDQGTTQAVLVRVATEREAHDASETIRTHFSKMETAWFDLGRMVRDALNRQVPSVLGMTAIDWLRSCVGASVSKVYRSLRIVKALEAVPEVVLQQLTEGKAYQLTRLQPKDRTSDAWIEKALELDNDAFQGAVDTHIYKKTGLAIEPRVTVSVRMDGSVAKLWKEAEEKLARVMELDILTKPGLRAQVFEGLATLVMTTDEAILRAEMVGDDGSEVPLGTK